MLKPVQPQLCITCACLMAGLASCVPAGRNTPAQGCLGVTHAHPCTVLLARLPATWHVPAALRRPQRGARGDGGGGAACVSSGADTWR